MKWAALITWVITALGGFGLLAIWLQRGGLKQADQPGRRIRPPLTFTHFVLAAPALAGSGASASMSEGGTPAEQHFPVPVVGLHGLLAATTLGLVLLTAVGVGGS